MKSYLQLPNFFGNLHCFFLGGDGIPVFLFYWLRLFIEKGQKIEKRICPIRNGSPKCVNCKKCGLLCGWGGAGAFSDGKLTLTPDVGGHLVDYMSREKVEEYIKYAEMDLLFKKGKEGLKIWQNMLFTASEKTI